jgi:predicted metal-dependent hydrolase
MKRAISNIISLIVTSRTDPKLPPATIDGVPVTLRVSPRARRLRLYVDPRTRSALLTMPRRVSRRSALAWAAEHGDWLKAALDALPEAVAIVPGTQLPLRGEPHRIDWHPERPRRIEVEPGRLIAGGPADGLEGRVLRWLKAQAHVLLEHETNELAAKAGVMASRIRVGDPVSRWGSCSSAGAIGYSWRLILAPDFVRRATVAHEVAHLVHLNHGHEFHALVENLLGADPRPARQWLRGEGASLHALGRRV